MPLPVPIHLRGHLGRYAANHCVITPRVHDPGVRPIVSAEETSTQVEVAFTAALEAEGLFEVINARTDPDADLDLGAQDAGQTDLEPGRPVLLVVSDNGPQMRSGSTVELTSADRVELQRVVTTGVHPARMIIRARLLLELDENYHERVDDQAVVADRVSVSTTTVRQVAKRFTATGGDVTATISRKQRATPPVASVLTGDLEARLIALACTAPPQGYSRWSLRLLEKHVALVEDLPDLDHSTIGRVLKKRSFALI